MIERNGQLELAGAYLDATKALEDTPRLTPDVVFADIEMPAISGLELARRLRSLAEDIQIVFVTAHEQYALQAFKVAAVNYILKPITEEDFSVTVNRLMLGAFERQHYAATRENRRRVLTLGGFKVFGDTPGQAIRWPTEKSRELFACFVSARTEALDKWQLCERLWPQSVPRKAEHSLHSAVNRLKETLRQAGISASVCCEKGNYRMDADGLTCDMWDLDSFFETTSSVNSGNAARFEKTLDLYRGELFASEEYDWCLEERERLRSLYLRGIVEIGRYDLAQDRAAHAERYLLKAAHTDMFDEEIVALLLQAYYRMGNKEKLAVTYRRLEEALRTNLGIVPKMETTQLYADLLGRM